MLSSLKKRFYSSDTIIRQFAKYSDFNNEVMEAISDRFKLLAENSLNLDVKSLLDTSDLNLKQFEGKKLVHISTWDTTCGIAAYCKALKEGLDEINILSKNDVISLDSNFIHNATYAENRSFYDDIAHRCNGYDIIVFQYEFGFFVSHKYHFSKDIELFLEFLKKLKFYNPDAKILLYIHSSYFNLNYNNTLDFFKVSNMLVELSTISNLYFNVNTVNLMTDWYGCGIHSKLGIDPVKNFYKNNLFVNEELKKEIKNKLDLKKDDVVIMMLGFINSMKRYDEMAKILALLPSNYKFLAAGGMFADSADKSLKTFEKTIKSLNLEERVFITGLFNDNDLGTFFDIADIMCAPYSKVRFGSGSIPMLFIPEKPVIAYQTDMINLINSQTDSKPVIEIEYDNREMFRDKILEVSHDSVSYKNACLQVKNYSSEICNKKLAKLVLKGLAD